MKIRRTVLIVWLSASGGFSTIETTAIVAGSSILTATATPQIQEYLESARAVKAAGDVRVIALSVVRLTADVHLLRLGGKLAPRLLVSDGEIPDATDPATRTWTLPLDHREVQPLASHLVDNAAEYAAAPAHPARWRGPYIDKLSADPWGRRYAINAGLFEEGNGHTVLVVSPGPNGIIETPYEAVGLRVGGDDVVSAIGRGR